MANAPAALLRAAAHGPLRIMFPFVSGLDELQAAARATERAWVLTIHAFCRRLLAQHPLAAGLDPRFRVLDASEAGRLADRAAAEAIEALLAACGILSVLTTTAIIVSLVGPTIGFFELVPIDEFLFGTDWTPQWLLPGLFVRN